MRRRSFSKGWSYLAGAVALAAAEVAFLVTFKSAIGLTAPLAGMAPTWTRGLPGGARWANAGLLFDAAIVAGAFLAAFLAGEFRPRLRVYRPRVLALALLGGLLMGIGARLAPGCNVGGVIGGVASFSLQGWVEAAFIIAGAYLGTRFLAGRG
ncbi:MAG: YeeE/YedE thiosulfate transporter family protein [Bacillota bacterium]